MRTVISHFHNESYLLPWWLSHHRDLFDYGVLINHGSTDDSLEIIKKYVPHWRVVNSTLTNFNAYMTDFEVMSYEKEIPGWKIALNTTEFLLSTMSLDALQAHLESEGRMGVACSGYILVDNLPNRKLTYDLPLLKQIHWGFSDNANISGEKRLSMNLGSPSPTRNRFFHRNPVGMYHPGRHASFHPEANYRLVDLMVLHCAFAPWNDQSIQRKLHIKTRLDPYDVRHGLGGQHSKSLNQLNAAYKLALELSYNLSSDEFISRGLGYLDAKSPKSD